MNGSREQAIESAVPNFVEIHFDGKKELRVSTEAAATRLKVLMEPYLNSKGELTLGGVKEFVALMAEATLSAERVYVLSVLLDVPKNAVRTQFLENNGMVCLLLLAL